MTEHTSTPITDVTAWQRGQGRLHRETLQMLGELLTGVAAVQPETEEDANAFTARALGMGVRQLAVEERPLSAVGGLTWAMALAEWITQHGPEGAEVGPGDRGAPCWTETTIGEQAYRHPLALRVAFEAGTLTDVPCVIGLEARGKGYGNSPEVTVFVRPEHQGAAVTVLDRLAQRASELNPYRGRVLRASYAFGLALSVVDLPATLTRSTVVVPQQVWQEIDLGVASVRDQYALLNAHGLGCRRGVLLVGPPGTGKSAVSAVVAGELVGEGFTVLYVEATAGAKLLTEVVEEAGRLAPALVILEDLDLWCRDRYSGGGGGLSELLQAMDIAPTTRVLTLASTNAADTLDAAAIRTGRFDSVVEVGYPDYAAANQILTALIDGLPGGINVDTAAVAVAVPEQTSGSDLREIVRRAMLAAGQVSTAGLLGEINAGRYRPVVSGVGAYL